MTPPPELPPVISPGLTITYEVTRWDLFANWMTILLRNRLLQVFVLVALVFNGWLTLAPGLLTHPLSHTMAKSSSNDSRRLEPEIRIV